MKNTITQNQVQHIATLANIPVTDQEATKLATAFEETLEVVSQLKTLDVSKAEPTHQVTGLENVTREDVVIESQMFSQKQALANAQQTHNGYFVVPQLIDQD